TLLGCPKKFVDGAGNDSGSASSSPSATAPGGSQAAASAKPAIIDLCALIPVATVASTTGVPVNGTDPANDSGIPNCSYRASGKNPRIIIQKSLSTLPGVKSLWPGGRDLPGIGDAAYLTPKASELDVQKGKVVIRVAYEPGATAVTDEAHVEVLKKLAGLALPVLAN
ncbi:MAG: hypothetical protein ABI461_22230, partial [Polyangiaceae bacterium]